MRSQHHEQILFERNRHAKSLRKLRYLQRELNSFTPEISQGIMLPPLRLPPFDFTDDDISKIFDEMFLKEKLENEVSLLKTGIPKIHNRHNDHNQAPE